MTINNSVPLSREIIAGANVTINGGASATLEGNVTVAASGGSSHPWYWNPPLASSFTILSGDANVPVLTDDSDVGLMINYGPGVASNVSRLLYRTLSNPAGDWVMTARISCVSIYTCLCGLVYADSVSNRLKLIGLRFNSLTDIATTNLNGIAAGSSATTVDVPVARNFNWFRIEKSGTNIFVYVSPNGKQWMQFYTQSATGYLTNNPDRVGLITMFASVNAVNHQISCDYFTLTGSAV